MDGGGRGTGLLVLPVALPELHLNLKNHRGPMFGDTEVNRKYSDHRRASCGRRCGAKRWYPSFSNMFSKTKNRARVTDG